MSQAPRKAGLLRPPVLLALLVAFGLLGYVLFPRARVAVGVADFGGWFLDSYAVLAAVDAHRAGLDPVAPNPYDPLLRPHRYSDWWLTAGSVLGLSREHNFVVGTVWVALFLAAVLVTVRPAGRGEALWFVLLLLSPSVLQGVLRANNDLVIFSVLALVVWALRAPGRGRRALAVAGLALATGLKFYPVVGLAALLGVRPGTVLRRILLLGGVALAGVLVMVAAQMLRGVFPIEVTVHVWGGRLWPEALGLTSGSGALAAGGAGVLGLVAGWRWLAPVGTNGAAAGFALAAAVLAACFVAGLNYGYRWVFAIWLGPWLWQVWRDRAAASGLRRLALALLVLVPWLLWQDGLLCAAVNLGWLAVAPADFGSLQHGWRLLTQPLVWVSMGLLAGWLGAWLRAGTVALRSTDQRATGRTDSTAASQSV